MRQRALKVIKIFGILMVAGLAYAGFYIFTGIGIPCMFRVITGFQCPGCGMTHMCAALLRLDFQTAWRFNPAIFCMLPIGIVLGIYTVYFYIKTGHQPKQRWYNVLLGMMAAVLVVFGVVRNVWSYIC